MKPAYRLFFELRPDENIRPKVKDKVLLARYCGAAFTHQGEEFLLMEPNDSLAFLLKGPPRA